MLQVDRNPSTRQPLPPDGLSRSPHGPAPRLAARIVTTHRPLRSSGADAATAATAATEAQWRWSRHSADDVEATAAEMAAQAGTAWATDAELEEWRRKTSCEVEALFAELLGEDVGAQALSRIPRLRRYSARALRESWDALVETMGRDTAQRYVARNPSLMRGTAENIPHVLPALVR